MSKGTGIVPIGDVLMDAAQELNDPEFRRLTRPFYVAAAQRGVSLLTKETMSGQRSWSAPTAKVVKLPKGLEEFDAIYVYNGDACDVSQSKEVYIKPNMHRLGGEGYLARDKWDNFPDPLKYSHGWNTTPPPNVYFAGLWNGELHMSDSCLSFARVHIDYQGIGVDCLGEDFDIPYWMREAITDFVVLRGAKALMREDPQYLRALANDKKQELARSWLDAKAFYKRMDRKTREDTRVYLESFGGRM